METISEPWIKNRASQPFPKMLGSVWVKIFGYFQVTKVARLWEVQDPIENEGTLVPYVWPYFGGCIP